MRDPHVKAVYYEIMSGEGISYRDPEALEFSNHLGSFYASENRLQVMPTEHFASGTDAREALEPFLKAWEINADLTRNIGMLRFKFEKIDVIDRDPSPPGSPQVLHVGSISHVHATSNFSLHLTCSKYPEPPAAFNATPEVTHAYRRWLRFHSGKEPLQAMSYFVLTVAENSASGRSAAAVLYEIDSDVLRKIGELSSTKGDGLTARKAGALNQYHDLSSTERHWLEKAVRLLISRLGEHASGAQLSRLTFSDLPDL